MSAIAQSRFDQVPARNEYTSQYVSPNWEALKEVGAAYQAQYEKNKSYKNKLIDWIFDLKSKTSDKEFISSLNYQYNKLNSIEVSANSEESLDLIRQNIKDEIDKQNTRQKEEPVRLWKSGNDNLKKGYYSQAIQDYTDLIQLNPSFPASFLNRGMAYYNSDNYKLALNDINRYNELKPREAITYYYLGSIKRMLKDYMGSLSDFNNLIDLKPNDEEGYLERARTKSALGDYNGSISDNSKAIQLKPDFSMAWNNRGWAKYKLKNYSEAMKDFNKSIVLDPSNWVAYDSRQETKFALNDFKGCIEDCNNAILINSKCDNSYFLRGRAYYKQGNKTKSCEDWSKAGELGKKEAYDYINKYCK